MRDGFGAAVCAGVVDAVEDGGMLEEDELVKEVKAALMVLLVKEERDSIIE